MERSIVQSNVDEILEPSREVVEEIVEIVEQVAPARSLPSYHPTKWAFVNSQLDRVDTITNGRAGLLMQFFFFLLFGGTTAIVNLAIQALVLYKVPMPFSHNLSQFIADALGTEISVIANFMLNDTFTFRHMEGHARSWWARIGRFQTTALSGSVLTIVISMGLSNMEHLNPTVSQAIAIVIVTFYNFFFHQVFTYRRLKPSKAV
jgi:putative flippase GtrA